MRTASLICDMNWDCFQRTEKLADSRKVFAEHVPGSNEQYGRNEHKAEIDPSDTSGEDSFMRPLGCVRKK